MKATVSGVVEELRQPTGQSGQLQFWSKPSEILNFRSSNTPEPIAFTIPWYLEAWKILNHLMYTSKFKLCNLRKCSGHMFVCIFACKNLDAILSIEFYHLDSIQTGSYGSKGCGVFKRGIQNKKGFCIRINILKGNYWILRIGLVGASEVLEINYFHPPIHLINE